MATLNPSIPANSNLCDLAVSRFATREDLDSLLSLAGEGQALDSPQSGRTQHPREINAQLSSGKRRQNKILRERIEAPKMI